MLIIYWPKQGYFWKVKVYDLDWVRRNFTRKAEINKNLKNKAKASSWDKTST